jgi:hypothetical protein
MTASANPRCRLAPRTSAQESAPSIHNSFITTLNGIAKPSDHRSPFHLLTGFHHHRPKNRPTTSLAELPNAIQYP